MIVSVDELIENIGDAEYQQYLIDSHALWQSLLRLKHFYFLKDVPRRVKMDY